LREHFPWVEDPFRIEGALDPSVQVHRDRAELAPQGVALVRANPVLTGDGAAQS